MRSNAIDLTGQRFGMLTVLSQTDQRLNSQVAWHYRCDCGNEGLVRGFCLRRGKKSCGCSTKKQTRATREERGQIKHGLSLTVEYKTWVSMKRRCFSPGNKSYPNYGGRGITVCDKWKHDFLAFLEDMGKRPSDDHSIDRIDVDGNYEPSNCQWATSAHQTQNRRVVKMSKVKVRHLRMMHESGEYAPVLLAKMFQISTTTCNRIISRITWKDH